MPRIQMIVLCAGLMFTTPASAQEQTPAPKPASEQPQPARSAPQLANIRLDLTIVDQRSDSAGSPKIVTMMVEDRQNGRIRTSRGNASLNVDGRPEIMREGKIRLSFSLEYAPQDAPDRPAQPPIQESITVLLDDGKSLAISQSADPTSDRKVRVEVKASIVK